VTASLENMTPEQISSLAALGATMRDNPATRREFLQLAKKANPSLSIPEIELEHAAQTEFKARDDKIADLEGRLAQQAQQSAAQARIAARPRISPPSSCTIASAAKHAATRSASSSLAAAKYSASGCGSCTVIAPSSASAP